jgi:hypothetical protein
MAPSAPDPELPFPDLFGRLLELLRQRPEPEAAVQGALDQVAARVLRHEALIEAGIENSWAVDGDPLKERLQARRVDAILIAAGTDPVELLALARALATDDAPVPSTASIRVKLLPDPLPLAFSGPRESIDLANPALGPRLRDGDRLVGMVEGILRELEKAIARQQWLAALHDAQAALRFLPQVREDIRRTLHIALKRQLTRPVVEALIEQGYRIPEEQKRTAEVLRVAGFPAAERMLEILKQSDTIGPRAFLLEALGGMPEAMPLAAPLLRSSRAAEVWLGVELTGKLGGSEAIRDLAPLADHPDERIRLGAIDALARFREKPALDAIRKALNHDSSATRSRAGQALASRGSGAYAMPLLAALEAEKDPDTWEQLLRALAAINAPESVSALTRVALERHGRFSFGKAQLRRQLGVVRSLAETNTPAARQALERISLEGQGEVAEEARRAVERGSEK